MNDLNSMLARLPGEPGNWDLRIQIAEALRREGRTEEAINVLRQNSLSPITSQQSVKVKTMLHELEPDRPDETSGPAAGAIDDVVAPGEEVALAAFATDDDGVAYAQSVSEYDEDYHGERHFIVDSDIDMEALKPQEKANDAAQKVSALTAALAVHVAVIALLALVVIYSPLNDPPQIFANQISVDDTEVIENVKVNRVTKASAASSSSTPIFAISAPVASPVAIPEFDESESMDITVGMAQTDLGPGMSMGPTGLDDGAESMVNFFGIKASGRKIVFVIEAARFMLTDPKGGIPAYDKVKEDIGRILDGMNKKTGFNIVLFEGKKIASFQEDVVEASPSNVRLAMEWLNPINREYEKIGIQEGYVTKPLRDGIEPIPVDHLAHYVKAMQRALEMDVSTVFCMTSGWVHLHNPLSERELEIWLRRNKWTEKEEKEWNDGLAKAKAWLEKENAARREKGVPQRVIRDWHEILAEVFPDVPRRPSPGYPMEDVEEQVKDAINTYYRDAGKTKPQLNLVWFIGDDEVRNPTVEAHLDRLTKRNRGELRILEGLAGLKNVTGKPAAE